MNVEEILRKDIVDETVYSTLQSIGRAIREDTGESITLNSSMEHLREDILLVYDEYYDETEDKKQDDTTEELDNVSTEEVPIPRRPRKSVPKKHSKRLNWFK